MGATKLKNGLVNTVHAALTPSVSTKRPTPAKVKVTGKTPSAVAKPVAKPKVPTHLNSTTHNIKKDVKHTVNVEAGSGHVLKAPSTPATKGPKTSVTVKPKPPAHPSTLTAVGTK